MNRRIIKSVLRNKIKSWLDSIDDNELKREIKNNIIVSGGSIASMLLKEKVNDYDIYFKNKETVEKVARYYVKMFNEMKSVNNDKTGIPIVVIEEDRVRIRIDSAGITSENSNEADYEYFEGQPLEEGEDYVEQVVKDIGIADDIDARKMEVKVKEKFRPVFLSDNAINLSGKMQLIIRFYGQPEEIHENFDFVHCTGYYTTWDKELILSKEALESLITKQLYYVGSLYPICSIMRMRKFIQRGWNINAGQVLKILLQVSKLDLEDIKVLEDQLTGVDTAYFTHLISMLKEKQNEADLRIDSTYISTIVDKLFG